MVFHGERPVMDRRRFTEAMEAARVSMGLRTNGSRGVGGTSGLLSLCSLFMAGESLELSRRLSVLGEGEGLAGGDTWSSSFFSSAAAGRPLQYKEGAEWPVFLHTAHLRRARISSPFFLAASTGHSAEV